MTKKATQLIREGYQVLSWSGYAVLLIKRGPTGRKRYAWVGQDGRVRLEKR